MSLPPPSEITEADGAVVISIEVARRRYHQEECKHVRTVADEELAQLHCRDCKKEISPIWWIIRLADHWSKVEANRRTAIHEQERAQARTRMKCGKCGEWVRFWGSTADEKARKATREGRYEAALHQIAILVPDAAGLHAARIAKAALAARDEEPPRRLAVAPAAPTGEENDR